MKVLVTGGAGYLGVVLVDKLLERGHKVRVLDSFYWGESFFDSKNKNIELLHRDIRNIKRADLKNIDAVIHFAGISTDPMADYDADTTYEINTDATEKLAMLCKNVGIKKFTFASSASIYDRGLNAKIFMQNEKGKVYPKRPYSVSKKRAENILNKLADENFHPVSFRHGTVYGYSPRMRFDLVVNSMFKSAIQTGELNVFNNGTQWRPLIDARDIADAHIKAIESEEEFGGEVFNLVYKNYQVKELAKIVQKVLLKKLKLKTKINVDKTKRKDRSYRMSGVKTKKVLGFKPQYSVEDSVLDMVEKYENFSKYDFSNPKYYNIEWFNILKHAAGIHQKTGRIY